MFQDFFHGSHLHTSFNTEDTLGDQLSQEDQES